MTLDDAVQRWSSTILLVNGVPSFIETVDSTGKEDVFKLRAHTNAGGVWKATVTSVPADAISEVVPELGNRQVGKAAFYVSRRATHQWKRGLVPGQIHGGIVGEAKIAPSGNWAFIVPSPNTIDVLYDTTYVPMLSAVRDVARGDFLSRCFSKDLSVGAGYSRWPTLYYRTNPVGLIKGDIVELAAPAACLRELVQESSPLRVVVN